MVGHVAMYMEPSSWENPEGSTGQHSRLVGRSCRFTWSATPTSGNYRKEE